MHVVDPEIVVAAVSERRDPRQRPLLRVCNRNLALLRRRVFLLDDAERQFGQMLQFDLLLRIQARRQFPRADEGNAHDADEAENDQRRDPAPDGHPELAQYCKRHLRSPLKAASNWIREWTPRNAPALADRRSASITGRVAFLS
jgi:hypothetical protein